MAAAGRVDAEGLVAKIKSRLGCSGQPDAEGQRVEGPQVRHMLAPEYVALGPRQWDDYPTLKRESDKLERLNDLLRQAVVRNNNNRRFEDLLSDLIDRVIDATLGNNHRHDDSSQQECSQTVKRMLLDGCYIVQVFANGPPRENEAEGEGGEGEAEDLEVGRRGVVDERTTGSLWRDTWFLVDNYVPYGVVDMINQLVYANNMDEGLRAAEAAHRQLQRWHLYADCVQPRTPRELVQLPREANYLLCQFADLLKPKDPNASSLLYDKYSTCGGLRPPRRLEEGSERWVWQWQQATNYLRRCNVRFVVSPLDGKDRLSVLDVTANIRGCFRSIDVRMPHLHINDAVLVLLRNLVEMEQRRLSTARRLSRTAPRPYVTAYCYFMYKIASQPKDVEFLQKEGIIDHAYNDPMDVVKGLREVVGGASVTDYSYLQPIAEELGRRFYRSTVHRRLSWLRASYWTKKDVLALAALFLTLVALFVGVPSTVDAVLSIRSH